VISAVVREPGDFYGRWFGREGDNVRLTLDVSALGASAQITVSLYSKNVSDPGDGAPVDPSVDIDLSTVGRVEGEWSLPSTDNNLELKELVRYKCTVAGSWVMFRLLPPVWFDSAAVT
jgi:hypothetical protein